MDRINTVYRVDRDCMERYQNKNARIPVFIRYNHRFCVCALVTGYFTVFRTNDIRQE